jgi:hypothetical protein
MANAPTLRAYLQFGSGSGPFQTVEAPATEDAQARPYTVQREYGARLPTSYRVKWQGRWRRVYAARYGNAATFYIGRPRHWLATVSIDREA